MAGGGVDAGERHFLNALIVVRLEIGSVSNRDQLGWFLFERNPGRAICEAFVEASDEIEC